MATYYAWAPIVHKNEDGSSVDLAPEGVTSNNPNAPSQE